MIMNVSAYDNLFRKSDQKYHMTHQDHTTCLPPSQDTLGQREVEQERLHAGHLEVGERVGVQVVGEAVADLILQSQYTVQSTEIFSSVNFQTDKCQLCRDTELGPF